MRLIDQRDKATGQNNIMIFDTLFYSMIEKICENSEEDSSSILVEERLLKLSEIFCNNMKNYRILAVPVVIEKDNQKFVLISDMSINKFTLYNLSKTDLDS